MADLEPLQRSMIDMAGLLGIPTAGSPPPTWAELGSQVHAAVRTAVVVCKRATIYHAAVTKLLGYEPCPTEEGAKAAAADLLGRGFAEALRDCAERIERLQGQVEALQEHHRDIGQHLLDAHKPGDVDGQAVAILDGYHVGAREVAGGQGETTLEAAMKGPRAQ